MKYVDTPPILAILFSKQQTPPPNIWEQFKETPPQNWLAILQKGWPAKSLQA